MAGFQILTVNYLRLRLVVGEVYKKMTSQKFTQKFQDTKTVI